MQSAIHPEVRFARVPPLWPETYTDLYKIDLSADAEEVNEAIETVTRHVEDAYYHYDENFRLFSKFHSKWLDAEKNAPLELMTSWRGGSSYFLLRARGWNTSANPKRTSR